LDASIRDLPTSLPSPASEGRILARNNINAKVNIMSVFARSTVLNALFAGLAVIALALSAPAGAADVGDQAKLKAPLLDGKSVTMEQLKGKVVMVNFWATWCSTCKAEMPQWQKFYDAHKAQGFEIIAVSIDEDENELKKQAKERGFTFPLRRQDRR
jgi:thiol-disulfide isomerase/thioredoxin